MKIAAAFLADSANIREGTLSILSGFLNQFGRPEFPAKFEATLVIVGESSETLIAGVNHEVPLSFSVKYLDTGEEIAAGNGGVQVTQEAARSGFAPMVINLHDLLLPGMGKYEVTAKIGEDSKVVQFYVDQS